MAWFRLYSEAIDDEKLRLLAFEDRWHFVALLCCKSKGLLDSDDSHELKVRKIALKLGLSTRELDEVARRLSEVGLIDRETLQPLAWDERQYQSDASTDRVRKFRERQKQTGNAVKRQGNVSVTAQETETETETESPLPPTGGEPVGSEGAVFPNLDDYVDLDELPEADELSRELPAPASTTGAVEAAAAAEHPLQPAAAGEQAAIVMPTSAGAACTSAGSACLTLKAAGIADVAPGNPKLKALLDAGATLPEFLDAAQRAVAAGNPRFGYVLAIVANERRRAAELAAQLHVGAMPAKVERPTFAQAQADIARSTVPGREGRDPTLARIEADAARAAPMPPEVRARLAALRRSA